ncbi:hypothetical protein CDAR_267441 [Caerostris darwini]|uniref:Uncharacterized protein n=1 Tax=Caerostris darwini TaxID=1538125 RepID=A0AAV4TM27_9ARAC|nr:hypothetical protein CDAR_267441 [Caerostris darwini]
MSLRTSCANFLCREQIKLGRGTCSQFGIGRLHGTDETLLHQLPERVDEEFLHIVCIKLWEKKKEEEVEGSFIRSLWVNGLSASLLKKIWTCVL